MVTRTAPLSAIVLALLGCSHQAVRAPSPPQDIALDDWNAAIAWQRRAARAGSERRAARASLACAAHAYRAVERSSDQQSASAVSLASACTRAFLRYAFESRPIRWRRGPMQMAGVPLEVEFRDLSPHLRGELKLTDATDVPIRSVMGPRRATSGFGVALVAFTPRCKDRPICALLPLEGVFRPATAWIEAPAWWRPDGNSTALRLVVANPIAHPTILVAGRSIRLASDTSAAYGRLLDSSSSWRLALLGLLWSDEVGCRAGVYLPDDYDARKRPIIMIHGLGSSPLTWARLSNAILGDARLRRRFQVWHVIYQTNAPMLLNRRRIAEYLDRAWLTLDPEGDDPARMRIVLVGHSMGGVLSRLLCASSGEGLWSAAFSAPPDMLRGSAEDIARIESFFYFEPYPGISRAIFLAAPHAGTLRADLGLGRFVQALVGRPLEALEPVRRIVRQNASVAKPEVLALSHLDRLSSVTTLGRVQPVMLAAHKLMPAAGIRYNTIAGNRVRRPEPGDGFVPLSSALLVGAESTLLVNSGHEVQHTEEAVQEILRILHGDDGA